MPIGVKYGLTADEFYRLNPKKMERYQPFLMARYKLQKDEDSERGWVNGAYVARAIGASFSRCGKYPNSPIAFYETNTVDDEFTDVERFKAFAAVFNKANEARFAKKSNEPDTKSDNTESQ